MPRPTLLAILLLLTLAALSALYLDPTVTHYVHTRAFDSAWRTQYFWLRKRLFFIWPGHFASTVLAAALLFFLYSKSRPNNARAALLLLFSGILSGANSLIKWLVGRPRPNAILGEPSYNLTPLKGGLKGLFQQVNLGFPSGDVALAAAMAACLSFLLPRYKILWWCLALIVALQRIAENAHHLSDTLAGAALGIVAFQLARFACNLFQICPQPNPPTQPPPHSPPPRHPTAP